MSEKMREEFEAWMHTFDLPPALEGEVFDDENYMDADCYGQFVYDDHSTQRCWAAWQASRESLVIDLPAPLQADLNPYGAGYVNGSLKMLSECQEVIEKAGMKVKP